MEEHKYGKQVEVQFATELTKGENIIARIMCFGFIVFWLFLVINFNKMSFWSIFFSIFGCVALFFLAAGLVVLRRMYWNKKDDKQDKHE